MFKKIGKIFQTKDQAIADRNETDEQKNQREQEERELEEKVHLAHIDEISKNSSPLWLTNQFVERPFHTICVCILVFCIAGVLTVTQELFTLSDNNQRDYLIWSSPLVEVYDMREEAYKQFNKENADSQIPERSFDNQDWTTYLIVECKDCNILTPKGLKLLAQGENAIKNHKDYKKFCLASATSTDCSSKGILSFTSLFNDPLNASQTEIDDQVTFILKSENWDNWKFLFSKKFSSSNPSSEYVRSLIKFGAPLKIGSKLYTNQYDDEDKQDEEFKKFSKSFLPDIKDISEPSDYDLIPYSGVIDDFEQNEQVNKDFGWAVGSVVFVLVYMTFHQQSIFLSSIAMLQIIISFPLTLVLFNLVFQVKYFSSLHILAIFVILGIAADDIFVFIDAWRQSLISKELEGDRKRMMATTFRRASKAMLATSSTTAAAFFATGLSEIMPVSSFGIFAGILVPMNFILVIIFFPSIVIIHDRYLAKRSCFPCLKKFKICNSQQQENQEKKATPDNQNQDIEKQQQQKQNAIEKDNQEKQPKVNNALAEQENIKNNQNSEHLSQSAVTSKQDPIILRFFNNQFNDFVYRFRYLVLLTFLIWFCISIWQTSELAPVSESESFLPDDFYTQKARNLLRNDFHASGQITDNAIEVTYFWGVQGMDTEDVGSWDSKDRGKIVWDKKFTLVPPQNQQWLFDFCEEVKKESIVLDQQITCFMTQFKPFVENTKKEQFPVQSESRLIELLKEFTTDPKGVKFFANSHIGLFKNELRYIAIELIATGKVGEPRKKQLPVYEKWVDLLEKYNKKAPVGLQNAEQTAGFPWVFMETEKAFVSNALSGVGISLAFAFLILLLTTYNILMSLYSVLCIGGIVVSVISVMVLMGWELGIVESITIVILIGMSVDYVVHLANHYIESIYPDRYRKIKISLKEIGISIISGAATTLGSGFFLFFAVLIIFNKFAILIFATILFSLAFALFFFASLMHVVGPVGTQGDVKVLILACINKFKKNKDQKSAKEPVEAAKVEYNN